MEFPDLVLFYHAGVLEVKRFVIFLSYCRNDLFRPIVAERLEGFEIDGGKVHLVQDDLPVVGPEFEEHPIQQFEGVAGVHDGLPVFLADLRILFGDVLIGEVSVDDRALCGVLDCPVFYLLIRRAERLLLTEEILCEDLGPRPSAVFVDEGIVLDDDPFAKSGRAEECAGLLKLFLDLLRRRVLQLTHERDKMQMFQIPKDPGIFPIGEVFARVFVEDIEHIEFLPGILGVGLQGVRHEPFAVYGV